MDKETVLSPKDRLIVALDVSSLEEVRDLVERLKDYCGMFKVGSQLFTRFGPEVIKIVQSYGSKVFLDLKFHDIPNVVGEACKAATELGVFMLTVHASGGSEMMERAVSESVEVSNSLGVERPRIVGVTVLTSIDEAMLGGDLGVERPLIEQVSTLSMLAEVSGLDGVVISPLEVAEARRRLLKDFLIVVPGVRPEGYSEADDQRRVNLPREAIKNGADYLVIGRPVTKDKNPEDTALKVIDEINEGLEKRACSR